MGSKGSKPIKKSFYEGNKSIIDNIRKVEYYQNYKNEDYKNEDLIQLNIIFILTFMVIIGILYSSRKR
jgi:hypothetical protein